MKERLITGSIIAVIGLTASVGGNFIFDKVNTPKESKPKVESTSGNDAVEEPEPTDEVDTVTDTAALGDSVNDVESSTVNNQDSYYDYAEDDVLEEVLATLPFATKDQIIGMIEDLDSEFITINDYEEERAVMISYTALQSEVEPYLKGIDEFQEIPEYAGSNEAIIDGGTPIKAFTSEREGYDEPGDVYNRLVSFDDVGDGLVIVTLTLWYV